MLWIRNHLCSFPAPDGVLWNTEQAAKLGLSPFAAKLLDERGRPGLLFRDYGGDVISAILSTFLVYMCWRPVGLDARPVRGWSFGSEMNAIS